MNTDDPSEKPSLREIYLRAVEKKTLLERSAFLDGACGDNLELRSKVEALLNENAADNFLEEPAVEGIPTLEETPLSEGPGTVIDRYKLLQKIGEGGMGVVYMAEQTEPVTRKVALKIIKLGMDTKQVVARFEAERQALAMMDHPNIAKVLDAGATDTGRPFFVMELVQGVPITEFCDKSKLSARERLELFIPVCQAIQSAHQKGIIHRDIKPSNVLVTLHHGEPMPKVIDFGIAKATNQKLTEKTLFTNYATMIGTPAYMSPEQAELSSMDVDTRTDVYSLGVLLYELLTGTTPFPEKRLRSLAYGEMQRVIAEEEPEKPSTRMSTMVAEEKTAVARTRGMEVSALGTQFKGDLDWITMKCLEKDRRRRYDTPNELVADLKRHLNNEPVSAAAPTFSYQLRKFYRRNRSYMRVAAAAAALLVVAAAVAGFQAVKATREEQRARDAQRAAVKARQAATSANEETQAKLYRSLVDQARAVQLARQSGFRTNVWRLLQDAMSIGGADIDRAELRSIAVACLDEPNRLEWRRTISIPSADAWRFFELTERHIVVGSTDGRVFVRDPVEGRVIALLMGGHSDAIASVVRLTDGETWSTSDVGGKVVVWGQKPGTGEWSARRHLEADAIGGIPLLLACGDGLLAYAAGSSRILIWERPDSPQARVVQLPFQVGGGRSVGVSPDGRFLLAAVNTASVREASAYVWDLIAGREVAVMPAPIETLGGHRVLFSDDGSIVVCASSKQVVVYDTHKWERLKSLRSRSWGDADTLALSRDGRVIAFGGGLKTIWNSEFDLETSTLAEAEGIPILSDDGSRLTLVRAETSQWRVERWELGRSETMLVEEAHSGNVFGLGISPDGRHLASSGRDGRVKLWSLDPWERLNLEDGDFDHAVEDPSFSFDGRLLVASHGPHMGQPGEGQITFWDMATKRRIRSISFGKAMGLVSFHPSMPLVAAAAGQSLGVWRYRLESVGNPADVGLQLIPIRELTLQRPAFMVGMDPQGRYVFWSEIEKFGASGGFDRSILRAMDLETGGMLAFNQPVGSGYNEFEFPPGGKRVTLAACGSPGQPGRIEIWDFLKNERLAQFAETSFPEAPTPSVMGLHPNGRHLVFQSTRNEALELWDIESQRMICRFPLPEWLITHSRGAVAGLKWSPNGEFLAVPLSTGQIRIWRIPAVRRALAELDLDW